MPDTATMPDLQTVLQTLLDDAKALGAETCDALVYNSISSSVSVRQGAVEEMERSENRDLGLRVIIGQKQASVSTTDFDRHALRDLAERCVAMAKAAPEDPYCGLAPKDRLFSGPLPDLELSDSLDPSSADMRDRALACEEAAMAVQGVTNSNGASASFGSGASYFATSDGFFGETSGGSHSLSVSVLAGEGTEMESDYDYDSATFLSDMRDAETIGKSAGERVVRRLNPQKMVSQQAAVVFEQRLAASLLGHFASAISGAAIARGVSFLKDKMDEMIFAKSIQIIDDPLIKRGFGSRAFDGEGVTSQRIDFIENGRLTNWVMNSSHAKQLGLETTGRASRGTGGAPGASTTNLYLKQDGAGSFDDLLSSANNGLFLTDMFGPQVNSNTGDYSVGCSGYAIENGQISHPVSEITIAGNILDMFANMQAADDIVFRGSKNAPSILIPQMTIAGQ